MELITFFTTGPSETRAWIIPSGAKSPEAAGAIHSDFEGVLLKQKQSRLMILSNLMESMEQKRQGKCVRRERNMRCQMVTLCILSLTFNNFLPILYDFNY